VNPAAVHTHLPPQDQVAQRVILVRPSGFGWSGESAATNAFQRNITDPDLRRKAASEFDALVDALVRCGIGVTVLDPADPHAPDAVFPNNWFSTHADARLVLYPMAALARRNERDPRLNERLAREGFHCEEFLDLSAHERDGLALEGTGSLVLDRKARTAYAAISPRTSRTLLTEWGTRMGYRPLPFTATMDGTTEAAPVYHTNVLMSVGERFALVCMEALPQLEERHHVAAELAKGGKELVQISLAQMHGFAANSLQLANGKDRFIFLSARAHAALRPDQLRQLGLHGELVPVPVPTIETVGGGSIRCMLAENFLPLRP
jgi:hypothetical protein